MWSEEVYQKALIFAANAHKDQKVKGKNYPYIVHIINVSIEVISAIFKSKVKNPDFAIQCALLHDTIEDTDTTYNNIYELFGKNIADGVLALTKDKKLTTFCLFSRLFSQFSSRLFFQLFFLLFSRLFSQLFCQLFSQPVCQLFCQPRKL